MRVIIVGGGVGALTCAETLRKGSDFEILMFSEEALKPYFRPSLSHMILNEKIESNFMLKKDAFFDENNIALSINSRVKAVDAKEKRIVLANDEILAYDKLVLATGSNSFILPVEGNDKTGVFSLKYYSDLQAINAYVVHCEDITIIGGGLLGIEAAWAFLKAGKKVRILEFSDRLMPRQLCEEAGELLLKELRRVGIEVLLSSSAKSIEGMERVESITLQSGETLKTDAILFSVGVRPNLELAKSAGVAVDRGILVNGSMQTSDKDIYAVGDCSQLEAMVPGIWPLAMQMGKIAATHILGGEMKMQLNPPITMLKALDIGVYSAGDISDFDDSIILKGDDFKFFAFKNGRFVGVNLIGNTKLSAKIPKLLAEQMTKEDIEKILGEMK